MTRWPIQVAGVQGVQEAAAQGFRRILLTAPTGTGKTTMMSDLAFAELKNLGQVILYTNRKMLLEQTASVFGKLGFDYGIRAAGHMQSPDLPFQIASTQTEQSRTLKKKTWDHFRAGLVLVDEAHQHNTPTMLALQERHLADGAIFVGVTATPINLGNMYDKLVVAGTTSDGRACGALVLARHFGCDEPDLRQIKRHKLGEDYSEGDVRKAIMVPGVFGRVLEQYKRLNPNGLPTILFAPDVKGSVYFAEEFCKAGIPAAHIDSDEVWINGHVFSSDPEARQEVMNGSRSGKLKVLCNRFVLREGIDAPWLQHGIFATVFGSLQSYLQSGGRLLRSCPGKQSATIQDHGGNWWRHGSLNEDRTWHLDWTASMYSGTRADDLAEHPEKEPFLCPACGKVLRTLKCECGFVVTPGRRSRLVIQADGQLREHHGRIFNPKRTKTEPSTAGDWKKMYWRAKNGGMTFRQAEGLFLKEYGYYPPHDLPLMPKESPDWFRVVSDVPFNRLNGEANASDS